jgi:hypothetical protein
LAAHFSFLPSEGGGEIRNPTEFKEYHCTFRDRLHEATEGDHWWKYGASDAEAEASLANLIDMYKRRGVRFFAGFEPFPDVFQRMTLADIEARDLSKMPAAMPLPYATLTLARIMKHLGQREKCREFAEAGLRHVGGAAGLKRELEQLRDSG